jgi:hypothetical protein
MKIKAGVLLRKRSVNAMIRNLGGTLVRGMRS